MSHHKLPRLRFNTSRLWEMATRVHVQLPHDVRLFRQMLSHMNCPPLTVLCNTCCFLTRWPQSAPSVFFESLVSIMLALITQRGGSVGRKLNKLVLNCIRQEEKESISARCSACKSSRRTIIVYSASRSLSPSKNLHCKNIALGIAVVQTTQLSGTRPAEWLHGQLWVTRR